jgi:hypothetical protein
MTWTSSVTARPGLRRCRCQANNMPAPQTVLVNKADFRFQPDMKRHVNYADNCLDTEVFHDLDWQTWSGLQ